MIQVALNVTISILIATATFLLLAILEVLVRQDIFDGRYSTKTVSINKISIK